MPQSLSNIIVHLVFSTKGRLRMIARNIRASLHAYLAEVLRNMGCLCFRVGGTADHVHLALGLARDLALAKVVGTLKTASSQWMKHQTPTLRDFAWQKGYGAFSVGASGLKGLMEYIDTQEEHHRTLSFQDEFRVLLDKYNLQYEERYVWD